MSPGQFLLELRCEEIPANALPSARAQLAESFAAELAGAGYEGAEVHAYSTVRRLVVHAAGLPALQPDRQQEVLGPPARAAFTGDGSPTPAAVGFARAHGIAVEALRVVKGPKGEVVAATRLVPGRPTPEVLAEITARVVPGLHFPKRMRWGAGEHTFVRPLHGIVALFGEEALRTLVPLALFGVEAGSATGGHRVVAPGPIELRGAAAGAGDYSERLARAGVVIDVSERRRLLEERARELAREVGCEVRRDETLISELVELVEQPGVIRGAIAPHFLELPEEVLVTTLRHHQKCLVLLRDGRVAPFFLAVCDRADDPEGLIRQGNEWVVGARLADAAFFFAHDRRSPLAARRGALERVTFHQKLGSFAEKSAFVARLAPGEAVAGRAGVTVDLEHVRRACELLKVDLTTAMVGEFPELQGVVGGIYARLDGEPEEVAQAIADQYTPAGLEGPLPRGAVAALVGVADRLDTLAAMFLVGEEPSGSRDPFALRRAALALVRICAELSLRCPLGAAAEEAVRLRCGCGPDETPVAVARLAEFLRERERFYLTSVVGVAAEVADAVLHASWEVVPDAVARARALESVRQEPVFAQLAVAFKRVRNMVAKEGGGLLTPEALHEEAERSLLGALGDAERAVGEALGRSDHASALRELGTLADPLDRFFTEVLVLCEETTLRATRLALLARVERLFLRLADLSRLSG